MSYRTTNNLGVAASGLFGDLKERAQLAVVFFTDVERSVVKATNRDLVVPKAKHVQTLVDSTWERSINLVDLFRLLQDRLTESYWAVAFKSLIVMHYLMREGCGERVMGYMSTHPNVLNVTGFRDSSSGGQGISQTRNIRSYAMYLEERVAAYRELKMDYVRVESESTTDRLSKLTWKEGLAKETEVLLRQMKALLDCKFFLDSIDNEITSEAERLLVKDLLRLSQLVSEAVINILQQFFTLEKSEAKQALSIYKTYVEHFQLTSEYLDVARRVQAGLDMTIPVLKHAPLSLAKTLQDYINSPDFEKSRLVYLEKKLAKSDIGRSEGKQSDLIDVFSSSFVSQQPAPTPSNNTTFANQTFFQPAMGLNGGNSGQMQPAVALVHQPFAASVVAQQPMQIPSGPAMLPIPAGIHNQQSANSSVYAHSSQSMMVVQQQQQQMSRQGSQYSQQGPSMSYGIAAQQPYANASTTSFPAGQSAGSFSQQSLPGSFNPPVAYSGQPMQTTAPHQPNPFGNVPTNAATIANPFASSAQPLPGNQSASSFYQVSRQQSVASTGSGVNSFNPIFAGAAVPNQGAPMKPMSTSNPVGAPNPQGPFF